MGYSILAFAGFLNGFDIVKVTQVLTFYLRDSFFMESGVELNI